MFYTFFFFQEGVARGGELDESSPGDEGHDDGEAKHGGGHDEGDTHGAPNDDGHDDDLDDSMSLSVSASHAPQQRYQQQRPPQPGQAGATVAEMVTPESPHQVPSTYEEGEERVRVCESEKVREKKGRVASRGR